MNAIHCKRVRGSLIIENKILSRYAWRCVIVHSLLVFLKKHKKVKP